MICFLLTPVLRFPLLHYYRRIIAEARVEFQFHYSNSIVVIRNNLQMRSPFRTFDITHKHTNVGVFRTLLNIYDEAFCETT